MVFIKRIGNDFFGAVQAGEAGLLVAFTRENCNRQEARGECKVETKGGSKQRHRPVFFEFFRRSNVKFLVPCPWLPDD
jgi:hypothetical protein